MRLPSYVWEGITSPHPGYPNSAWWVPLYTLTNLSLDKQASTLTAKWSRQGRQRSGKAAGAKSLKVGESRGRDSRKEWGRRYRYLGSDRGSWAEKASEHLSTPLSSCVHTAWPAFGLWLHCGLSCPLWLPMERVKEQELGTSPAKHPHFQSGGPRMRGAMASYHHLGKACTRVL